MNKRKKITDNSYNIKIVLSQNNTLQEYSPPEDYVLNPQLEEYIIGQAKLANIKNSFELNITASDGQKETFINALKKSFRQKILVLHKQMNKLLILSLFMLFAGISILVAGYFLKNSIMYEVFLVASWVFIWRAVETFFFDRQEKRIQILIYKKILAAVIK